MLGHVIFKTVYGIGWKSQWIWAFLFWPASFFSTYACLMQCFPASVSHYMHALSVIKGHSGTSGDLSGAGCRPCKLSRPWLEESWGSMAFPIAWQCFLVVACDPQGSHLQSLQTLPDSHSFLIRVWGSLWRSAQPQDWHFNSRADQAISHPRGVYRHDMASKPASKVLCIGNNDLF